MKKIGICTLYTGYNYGSALQATATKVMLESLGYNAEIWKVSGSLIPGRDVRIGKLINIGFRLVFHFRQIPGVISSYIRMGGLCITSGSKALFSQYWKNYIHPYCISEKKLKHVAEDKQYLAFVCGSDQIWNSTSYYVDPFYYLAFAPKEKRIAFAPSFGRDFIPDYNRKILRQYIAQIPFLSVREDTGRELIRNLVGREAAVLLDPTLLLNKDTWINMLGLSTKFTEKYVLAYFLNEPSDKAVQVLRSLRESGYQIVALPYTSENEFFDECPDAGPKEFLQFLLNAQIVCTDSFHGTAFSLNFEKEFYTFRREYGTSADQSTRLTSLLQKVDMMERYDAEVPSRQTLDYCFCRSVLEEERKKSVQYLQTALAVAQRSAVHE